MVIMWPCHKQMASMLFRSYCPYPPFLPLAYRIPVLVQVQNKVLVAKVVRLVLGLTRTGLHLRSLVAKHVFVNDLVFGHMLETILCTQYVEWILQEEKGQTPWWTSVPLCASHVVWVPASPPSVLGSVLLNFTSLQWCTARLLPPAFPVTPADEGSTSSQALT